MFNNQLIDLRPKSSIRPLWESRLTEAQISRFLGNSIEEAEIIQDTEVSGDLGIEESNQEAEIIQESDVFLDQEKLEVPLTLNEF